MSPWKFSATSQGNRNEVTEIRRYSDLAGTTLVGSSVLTIDDAHRLTAITHKKAAGATIDSFSYQFDNADRATQESSTLGPTRNYGYDDASQLTSELRTVQLKVYLERDSARISSSALGIFRGFRATVRGWVSGYHVGFFARNPRI